MVRVLIVIAVLATHAIIAQGVTLAWRFAPGDVQTYRMTQASRLNSGSDKNQKQVASVEQVLDLIWKVLEVDDSGGAKISLEVTSFSLAAQGPGGQEVQYDSQSTDEPQGYAAMLAPIGKRLAESPLIFTLNSRGDVTDVQLPESLADVVKSIPGGKKFAQDGGLTSIESLARLGAPLSLPKGEVAAGQKWSVERNVELPVIGTNNISFEYKIAEPVSEQEVTIEQQMSIAVAGEPKVTSLANQTSKGTVVFDVESGRPETSTLGFRVEISLPGDPESPLLLEQNTEFRRIADESQ